MTLDEFGKRADEIAKTIVVNVTAGFKATALVVDQTVVLATPVDTGRARSNWRVGDGQAPSGTIEPYSPGESGVTGSENASAAISAGKAVIDGSKANTLYISNNLDYIEYLNAGSSAQAPAGFVELAVQAGQEEVARIVALKGI